MVVDCNSIFEHWIHLCIKNIKCSIYVKEERRIHQWDQESKRLLNIHYEVNISDSLCQWKHLQLWNGSNCRVKTLELKEFDYFYLN